MDDSTKAKFNTSIIAALTSRNALSLQLYRRRPVQSSPTDVVNIANTLLAVRGAPDELEPTQAKLGALLGCLFACQVTCGLQFEEIDYQQYFCLEMDELHALRACLQLLVGGSAGCSTGQMGYEKPLILPALMSIEEKGVVKSADGKKILQVGFL
ncbi:hypothetical protein CPB84DRAFT_1747088 [Gymnopilus junonius]|uniref:Uncharacterized protein n=1 Tax=Gymnopilus junonius TaxID=109634 RepID=A0A9P5NLE2_GYMJU|nr:hypothetical protein CPB84DRAFT_1747088 [Gymnopilus junonius]